MIVILYFVYMLRGCRCSVSLPCGSVIANELEARSSYVLYSPKTQSSQSHYVMVLSFGFESIELIYGAIYGANSNPVVIVKHPDAMF